MRYQRLYNLLESLDPKPIKSGTENAVAISKPYKVLISKNELGYPSIFFKTTSTRLPSSSDLKHLIVEIGHEYNLRLGNKEKLNDTFSKITLTSADPELLSIFCSCISSLINLIKIPTTDVVFDKEFSKLIEIFRSLESTPRKKIRGLWAELFLIQESSCVESAMKYWHESPNATYDFSDKKFHIEVKSTTSDIREHAFSLHQAHSKDEHTCFIASVLLEDNHKGANIKDLVNRIKNKLTKTPNLQLKLDTQVTSLLGSDFLKSNSYRFNVSYARKHLKFCNLDDIPKIDASYLEDPQLSEIKFKSNIEGAKSLSKKECSIDTKLLKTMARHHL